MSCPHCSPEPRPKDAGIQVSTLEHPVVALVGNPNVGKSSLFNNATGLHQEVRNAPGTTVEMLSGVWKSAGVELFDLPGTYSLLAKSPDEQVTVDALAGRLDRQPSLAVVLLDATSLPRSLYLLGQVARTGLPVVAAMTMCDVAATEGRLPDAARLQDVLGIPVVAMDGRKQPAELAVAVKGALTGDAHVRGVRGTPLPADATLEEQLADAQSLFVWTEDVQRQLGTPADTHAVTRSDRIDRVLLHPWVGIPVFAFLMWALFQLATTVAAPVMDWAESLVTGPVTTAVSAILSAVGLGGGLIEGLLVDGILAGVGTVFSFAPLMFIMFLAIAILDDSGYLARAAFVADKAMRAIGLDGRALLPLIVGFGCNLPALAAARALPDARQRFVTAIVVPYTSCAARLTVYILLATVFFGPNAGSVIFLMYVLSILMVIVAGLVLRKVTGAGVNRQPLLMVLPAYQVPRPLVLLSEAGKRTWGFMTGAGKVIIITLTVVWLLLAVPVRGGYTVGDVPIEDSAYGATAEAIAPVFAPAGFGNWQSASALMTGFVAKEVVVGAFAQAYAVDEPEDAAEPGTLGDKLTATFDASSGGHAGAAALAFMIFVLTYTPCLATLAELWRMLGPRVTLAATGTQIAVAWLLAVAVFQLLKLVW